MLDKVEYREGNRYTLFWAHDAEVEFPGPEYEIVGLVTNSDIVKDFGKAWEAYAGESSLDADAKDGFLDFLEEHRYSRQVLREANAWFEDELEYMDY